MSGFLATRHPHAPDPQQRRIRLAERDREARELEWQNRLRILPLL
ncbi:MULTISPECIES: hypothetical protein [unclassified Microbacterium]|nr:MULTISPECIES: hypothetical protein [unclassified Microbacterium]